MPNAGNRKTYLTKLEKEIEKLGKEISNLKAVESSLQNQLGVNTALALVNTIKIDAVNKLQNDRALQQTQQARNENKARVQRHLIHAKTDNTVPELKAKINLDLRPQVNISVIHNNVNDVKEPLYEHEQQIKKDAEQKLKETKQSLEEKQKALKEKEKSLEELQKKMKDDLTVLSVFCTSYLTHLTESSECCIFMDYLLSFFHSIFYKENRSAKITPQNELAGTLTSEGGDAEKLDLFEQTMAKQENTITARRARIFFTSIYDGVATFFRYSPGESEGKKFANNAESILKNTRQV